MESKKGSDKKKDLSEQISQLQDLVEQMKEGFIEAMEELSLIQDGDRRKVESNKEETDKKIEDLTESVHQIRTDLSTVLVEVQKSNRATEKLAAQFERLRREQGRIRKKLKQNDQNQENQRNRHDQLKQSISQSSKSDGDNNNSNNSKSTTSEGNVRRRKSTPGTYSNMTDSVSREQTAPMMMQSFMDSLPDNKDLNNNVGRDVIFDSPMGTTGRQFEFPFQVNSGLPNSSDNDHGEMEQIKKALNSERGVSFSNLDQTHDPNDACEGRRLQLAEDFLLSERKYVGQLNTLLENIMLPLITESLIHPTDINIIFPPCLAKMFDNHCGLLCALETRLSDAKWQGMHSDIFDKFAGVESANFLSHYGSYISTFSESLSLLSRHTRKSAKLTKFLKKQLADIEDEQADLLGYLLAPIQRIPAYVLHLKTVLEYTEPDHPDYFHIESCLTHLGNFLAKMNPAIKQAVEAARTHKLFLSERRDSLASSHSPHVLMGSQSSLTNSGVQSMEDMQAYNRYTHHQTRHQEEVSGMMDDDMNGYHATWNGNPTRQRKSHNYSQMLLNGNKRNRRASFPGFSLMDDKRVINHEAMVQSNPRLVQPNRGYMGRRRSYDQHMSNTTYQRMPTHVPMFGGIPGMAFIPEQSSDDTESVLRSHGVERNGNKSSRSQTNLPELPRYGIYGEDDTDEEVGYEPSSPSSALPRARQTGSIQQQRSPRHKRQLMSSPASASDSSSKNSMPRDDHYYHDYTESPRTKIIFEESDIHQQQKYHQRSASGSNKHLKLKGLSSEDGASSTLQLQQRTRSESRRRAHSISHLNWVGTPESTKPSILNNVWKESKQVNGSIENISTPRTKQKSTLNNSSRENPTSATKSAKKSHFLTGSLRHIFFGKSTSDSRKRGSHVVELGETSLKVDAYMYCDEDGQPCSNV